MEGFLFFDKSKIMRLHEYYRLPYPFSKNKMKRYVLTGVLLLSAFVLAANLALKPKPSSQPARLPESTSAASTTNKNVTSLYYLSYLVSNGTKYQLQGSREGKAVQALLESLKSDKPNEVKLEEYSKQSELLAQYSLMIAGRKDTETIKSMQKAKEPAENINAAKIYLQERRLIQAQLVKADVSGDTNGVNKIEMRMQKLGDGPSFISKYTP
jgi:hypothetical protein